MSKTLYYVAPYKKAMSMYNPSGEVKANCEDCIYFFNTPEDCIHFAKVHKLKNYAVVAITMAESRFRKLDYMPMAYVSYGNIPSFYLTLEAKKQVECIEGDES